MFLLAGLVGHDASAAAASAPAASRRWPNLVDNIERPLRYRPDNGDFVIENGAEFFNRPLYGGNTAFRVDAGDRPEFVLYLPGRGGNLRLGLRTSSGDAKWLHEAETIVARYRPGSMLYEIRDPMLGAGAVLELAVLALHQTDGLIVRAEFKPSHMAGVADSGQPASTRPATGDGENSGPVAGLGEPGRISQGPHPAALELVFAYGGVTGQRGRRDGDIGTENVPISEWFQLKPEFCRDQQFELGERSFKLRSRPATIVGILPAGVQLAVADAAAWDSCADLLRASAPIRETPVATGRVPLIADAPLFLSLQRVNETGTASAEELNTYREVTAPRPGQRGPTPAVAALLPPFAPDDLPRVFAEAESHFAALRAQIAVETPDPFINAAVAALNVAADAVWDEPQGAVMHGAIAWRSKLLGWRGPYAMDALGWHDRARRHFAYWATRQNTDPIPEKLPPPDENANLARSETALHSNGDMSNSHYDMNLVYIDALFRHLRWTGDLDFAREMWPVIERHLAWERRLFRREFITANGETLPLYEAYAAIWASDDLQYHGGGTSHASAYNVFHNREAARLARLLGKDPAPYEREADLVARGMRELLWVDDAGTFAEFKDLLGLQLVHPSAALWTIYHTIDSEVATPAEALKMARYVEDRLPRIPVRGPGVPDDMFYGVYATSNWMPYTWSINNVVMGENIHTALAFWQAGRADDAFRLTKSALLASMFMGICPGNVGSMNTFDVYRRESQRDFADGSGVLSRAIVEGLFGIKPDALADVLRIEPGFPAGWENAALSTPDVSARFQRTPSGVSIGVEQRFNRLMVLQLSWSMPAGQVEEILVNGAPVDWEEVPVGNRRSRVRVIAAPANRFAVEIHEKHPGFGEMANRVIPRPPPDRAGGLPYAMPHPRRAEDRLATPIREPHTGSGSAADDLRDGASAAPTGQARRQLTPLDLTPHFNDRVTEIFRPGKYRSPRSPFVSLALPAQGIGAWAGHVNATAEIDDSGLRRVAAANGGRLVLPTGVSFATPGSGEARNIVFVSQWDNYPREATVPLEGRARRVHLLMAGSTNHMQSCLDNGEVVVTYADGTAARLRLYNPTTWWPIEQDYFIDDFQFRLSGPLPTRVDLKTGEVRVLDAATFKGRGGVVPGGAATVLELALDPEKELRLLTVRALANEVVIGLLAATLER